MDSYNIMASVASLEEIEILEVKEFMPSEVRLECLKNILFKGLKLPLYGNFVDFYPKPSKSRNFGPKVGKPEKVGDLTP